MVVSDPRNRQLIDGNYEYTIFKSINNSNKMLDNIDPTKEETTKKVDTPCKPSFY